MRLSLRISILIKALIQTVMTKLHWEDMNFASSLKLMDSDAFKRIRYFSKDRMARKLVALASTRIVLGHQFLSRLPKISKTVARYLHV